MATPLYSALLRHRNKKTAPFHMPGHKNNPTALPADLLRLDYTEIPDTGSLFDSTGPFPQAEALAAGLFATARTCLSAGGCTLCIQTMLRLALPRGGKLLCSRVIHRSAVNAMALLGLEPVWAMPDAVAQAAASAPDIRAVYVTSPTYYGQILDIPAIAAACRERDIPLLVDNAHGAHLMFTKPKLHPLAAGASMTADSAHKTLPVLTGGAWLQIADPHFADGAKQAMELFGSTSPSFPILASLDLCREWLQKNRQAIPRLQRQVAEIRQLALSRGFTPPPGQTDPVRLTLDTAAAGLPGTEAAALLRKAGVEPEYADSRYVILIPSPFNTEEDFTRLKDALLTLPTGRPMEPVPALPPFPPVRTTPREALLSPGESVELTDSVGKIAAEAACPCPPGIPIVMPGELITKEAAEFLRGYGFLRIKVLK